MSNPTRDAIGRVELVEKYRPYRHDIALEFDRSPDRFRLMLEPDDDGLMLVREHDSEESDDGE